MIQPKLSPELQEALDEGHGFVRGNSFVLMSTEMFREMMGVGSDEEMAASLKAIEEGLADVEAGRTIPLEKLFRDLDEKYGVHG